MPETQIPLKPHKPIWRRVIVGSLLLFTTIENRVNPANLLQASSPTEQLGMDGMAVIMAVVAIWLVISGIRPVWRKITN